MRKGILALTAFIFVVALAALTAIIFVLIFKVKITNAIIYEHKSDGIGLAYNTMLNLKYGPYENTENFGSFIVMGSSAPSSVRDFNTIYFKPSGIIYSIFPGQTCIDYFVRENTKLTIENSRRPCTNKKELVQMSVPIALPYNLASPVKIVSLVTVK